MNQTSTILSYLSLVAQLVETGKITIDKLRGFMVQEGVSPEELAALDARLSAAIAAREGEVPPTS